MAGNQTTTALNPAVPGGDRMHETLLPDGSKSPRVVLMDDEGNLFVPALESTQLDVLAAILAQSSGIFSGPFTAINGDVVPLVAAMPVAMPAATLLRAGASSGFALANVLGIVVIGAAVTLPVRALAEGVLTLPTGTWDLVTGGAGGLVPGARYYLGTSLGALTTTAPVVPGQYVTVIGSAISDVTLLVNPEPPILL